MLMVQLSSMYYTCSILLLWGPPGFYTWTHCFLNLYAPTRSPYPETKSSEKVTVMLSTARIMLKFNQVSIVSSIMLFSISNAWCIQYTVQFHAIPLITAAPTQSRAGCPLILRSVVQSLGSLGCKLKYPWAGYVTPKFLPMEQ